MRRSKQLDLREEERVELETGTNTPDSREVRNKERGLGEIVGWGLGTDTREIEKKLREHIEQLGWKERERRHRFTQDEAREAGKKGHHWDSDEAKEAGKEGHHWDSEKAREAGKKGHQFNPDEAKEAARKRWKKKDMLAG